MQEIKPSLQELEEEIKSDPEKQDTIKYNGEQKPQTPEDKSKAMALMIQQEIRKRGYVPFMVGEEVQIKDGMFEVTSIGKTHIILKGKPLDMIKFVKELKKEKNNG